MKLLALTLLFPLHTWAFLPAAEVTLRRHSCRVRKTALSTKELIQLSTDTYPEREGEDRPWILNPKYMNDYDQDRDWGFVYSSVPPEGIGSYQVVDVEGEIPSDLRGTYYKIGGAKFERGGKRYEHVLDGDGFVVALNIQENGRVQYTGRFVETEFFVEEQAADEIRYRNVFGTQRPGGPFRNAFDLKLKNVANTNVLFWGGRLFALWEAGRPYELDPVTLETLPPRTELSPFTEVAPIDCNLRGVTIDEGGMIDKIAKVGRSFTAHPHIVDEDTMVAFTAVQNMKEECFEIEFLEYDAKWNLKQRKLYTFPDAVSAPHDFSIGENYYGFIENKITVDTLPYLLGLKGPAQVMRLQLKQAAQLHLVSRKAGLPDFQVPIPPYFAIHSLDRLEENQETITMISNGWDLQDETFFPGDKESVPFLGSWGGQYPDFDFVPPAKYCKTVVDRKTGTLISHEEIIPGLVMEFETGDEREPEYSYVSISTLGGESLPGVGLARINTKIKEADVWWAENKIFTGEMRPVPKENGDQGSWLLGLIYDAGKRRTSLVILDSERYADGPVARIHLPHHVSYGLHSTFVRDAK